MAIEVLLIVLGTVLFGGMFLGLFLSYRDTEAERTRKAEAVAGWVETSNFYHWRRRDAGSDDLMLRQIEHHLREEELLAEQFVRNPNRETLRAGARAAAGR